MKHKPHLLLYLLASLSLFLAGCGTPKDINTAGEPPGSVIESSHEEPPPYDFPVEELEVEPSDTPQAIARAMAQAPAWLPVWEPPTLREPTKVLGSYSSPKAGANGLRLERVRINYTGYWGAWVSFNQPHARTTIQDVEVNCINGSDNFTQSKWAFRPYKLDGLINRCIIRGPYWEHCLYSSTLGNLTIQNCWFEDAGAQGIQLRHNGNRSDPLWNAARQIVLRNVYVSECGQKRGIGRAGSSISIKDQGPLTDVVFDKVAVRTIQQQSVKVQNGKTFDSFGGVCIEFCRSFTWRDGWVQMRNPDRPAVQLFDYARKEPTRTGPASVDIEGLHLESGILALRVGDGERIEITNCTGNGWIQCYRWNGTDWKLDPSMTAPIGQGFFWVK
jgi:hypothetical protein